MKGFVHGLENGLAIRDDRWSEAIAVGSRPLVEKIKGELGVKATYREEQMKLTRSAKRLKLTDSNSPLKVRL